MPDIKILAERISNREYTVGIIGLGYVGLPLLLRFGEAGFKVLGFDVDREKVELLNSGTSYLHYISGDRVATLVRSGFLEATQALDRLGEADALLICVPTPLNRHREPDLQYVRDIAFAIAQTLRPGQLVCLESTTYPGTTEEILLTPLTVGGLRVGEDFFLAYSPEREDPGNTQYITATIPKVVGGVTPGCLDLASTLYSQVVERVIRVSSTRVAEATKLLENIYRAVNIAMVNELKMTFDRMGIDIWEVIEAAKTKPFGFHPFYPGPGLGGHCIPIDPFYLTWKAREYGISTRFVELAGEINRLMPSYVVQKLVDALNTRCKSVSGSRVLVLGVAYKRDVGDLRESPALEILTILLAKGAIVEYSDPFFSRLPTVHRNSLQLESVPITEEAVRQYDAVVLVTDHSNFPYEIIFRAAPLIVDSRNAFKSRGFAGPHLIGA